MLNCGHVLVHIRLSTLCSKVFIEEGTNLSNKQIIIKDIILLFFNSLSQVKAVLVHHTGGQVALGAATNVLLQDIARNPSLNPLSIVRGDVYSMLLATDIQIITLEILFFGHVGKCLSDLLLFWLLCFLGRPEFLPQFLFLLL
jgi:hypothetical protein